jgi:hypothetical protein
MAISAGTSGLILLFTPGRSMRTPKSIWVRLVGYGVKSANDVPARDPKDWHLEIANNFIPVHSVANEHFPNRYETHWFSLTVNEEGMPQPTRMIRIVVTDTLRRRMEGARIPGTQVGQLYFLVVDEE